jgi:hypothetical protein
MAGSKFFQRYRELKKYQVERSYETRYENDCKEVLQALGNPQFQQQLPPSMRPVMPLKYHGKLVRTEGYAQELRIERQDREKKKAAQALVRRTLEQDAFTKQLADSLKYYVESRSTIPKHLIVGSRPKPHSQSPSKFTEDATIYPKLLYTRTTQPRVLGLSRSDQMWRHEERQRMHSIYQQMPPPHSHSMEQLEVYRGAFAEKFRAYFPLRSRAEVMEKLRNMLIKKQLKEPGETQYWQEIQTFGHAPGQK